MKLSATEWANFNSSSLHSFSFYLLSTSTKFSQISRWIWPNLSQCRANQIMMSDSSTKRIYYAVFFTKLCSTRFRKHSLNLFQPWFQALKENIKLKVLQIVQPFIFSRSFNKQESCGFCKGKVSLKVEIFLILIKIFLESAIIICRLFMRTRAS